MKKFNLRVHIRAQEITGSVWHKVDRQQTAKKDRIDALLHSSTEIDQIILLESELLEDSIRDHADPTIIAHTFEEIRNRVLENSEKTRAARILIREMN